MLVFFVAVITALLLTSSASAVPSKEQLLPKIAQSPDICHLNSRKYKTSWIQEDLYEIIQSCSCDTRTEWKRTYARPEIEDCLSKCIFANDGQTCDPDNMPLWETYGNCCNECSGKMSTATISSRDNSVKITFSTIDKVCTHTAFISPTPIPRTCTYSTNSYKSTYQSVSTVYHKCSCGNEYKSVYTYYDYTLETCAKNCIAETDGNECNKNKMPFHSYYDSCCTSCGGELWSKDISTQSTDSSYTSRVCIVPLAVSPTPSATPRALICKHRIYVEESLYLSAERVNFQCQCD